MATKDQIKIQPQKRRGPFTSIAELLAQYFPDLRKKLRLADLDDNPIDFLEKVSGTTAYISLGLLLVSYLLLEGTLLSALKTSVPYFILLIIAPLVIVPVAVFYYLMLYPDSLRIRREKELDYEIVFAGRHIVIAMKSGMPLFDTFAGASTGYGAVSKELSRIVDKVVAGVPVTQAIREVVANNPSKYFNRVMMQISNAVSSGADVGDSLENALEQISKEQMISLREYSQKLTPIVMFYMIFGIIVPSLGIVLATVIFSAISGGRFGFQPGLLVIALVLIALIQFLFLGFMESSRPRYLL